MSAMVRLCLVLLSAALSLHAWASELAPLDRALRKWEEARTLVSTAVSQSFDPQSTVFALAGMLAALAPEAGPGKG